MAGFTCPFCGVVMAVDARSHEVYTLPSRSPMRVEPPTGNEIRFDLYTCPNCNKTTYLAYREAGDGPVHTSVFPKAIFKHFPSYVPQPIRQDYEEACSILSLSPKAAATLCRRCLQGMIHDFWQIHGKTLNAEITALKGMIPATQWAVIDAVRELGNIGAHMEHDVNLIVDIDPDEAEKLIRLIERLIQSWYIERHAEQNLYNDILGINQAAQQKRQS